MAPVFVPGLIALAFAMMPWLCARWELPRSLVRYQFRLHVGWPYAVRILLAGPLVAIPVALVGAVVAVPHEDAGPLIIAFCLAAGIVLAAANFRPPRFLPRWLAAEIEAGSVLLPQRGLYDWAFLAFFELAWLSGIILVLQGANK